MKFRLAVAGSGIALIAVLLGGAAVNAQSSLTDPQIRQTLINRSIARYSGRCPCPYNVARNGSICGGRSAYSRSGGRAPMCYLEDVPQSKVDNYRRSHR